MGFQKGEKRANSHHPQCVTLVIDDSGSMEEQDKCKQVTEAVRNLVITVQSLSQGSRGYRYLLNICKFGDSPIELAVAQTPPEVDLDALQFMADSGGTDMLPALQWAEAALKKSLERCRSIPNYREKLAPNPLCIFLSDGECTGKDPRPAAEALRAIKFEGGEVDVVAVGVGMLDEHFEMMKAIASRPGYAVRIDSGEVADFLGDVQQTVLENKEVARLAMKR